ncbi:MAG: hypothetical protein M3R02_29835, partial [Chloroflexota bacterium]|nr:hypothetical protein [Chloroflexota bacterium]
LPSALARSDLRWLGSPHREPQPSAGVGSDDGTQLTTDHQRWTQPPRRLVEFRRLEEAVGAWLVGHEDAEAGVVYDWILLARRVAGPR